MGKRTCEKCQRTRTPARKNTHMHRILSSLPPSLLLSISVSVSYAQLTHTHTHTHTHIQGGKGSADRVEVHDETWQLVDFVNVRTQVGVRM